MNVTAETFHKAIEFATRAHKGVYRKGNGAPYITHPLRVMMRIMDIKRDSSNQFALGTAAMLHDTVEDVPWVTLEIIAEEFGYPVASLVRELTLDKELYKEMGKSEYLAFELTKMSSYALTLKLCDRLENVLDMRSMKEDFQRRYTKETFFILEQAEKNRNKITDTQAKLILQIREELKLYTHLLEQDSNIVY